jgi:hypothetical protein
MYSLTFVQISMGVVARSSILNTGGCKVGLVICIPQTGCNAGKRLPA